MQPWWTGGTGLWWPHWSSDVWRVLGEGETLGALHLCALLCLAALLVSERPREAVALLSGWLTTLGALLNWFTPWIGKHPHGRLITFLNHADIQPLWLLLPALTLSALALLALRILDGFTVPCALGGLVVRPGSLLSIPLLMLGFVLSLAALIQVSVGLIGVRVGLAVWQSSLSGGGFWQPPVLSLTQRRVWKMPLRLLLVGLGLLLADSLFH